MIKFSIPIGEAKQNVWCDDRVPQDTPPCEGAALDAIVQLTRDERFDGMKVFRFLARKQADNLVKDESLISKHEEGSWASGNEPLYRGDIQWFVDVYFQ